MKPCIEVFFDPTSATFSYVVYEQPGAHCAIIDCVLDYDPRTGRTGTTQADKIAAFVREHHLQLQWLLETHAHADHLSAAPYLKQKLGGKIAIGAGIREVQQAFKDVFNLTVESKPADSAFDHLFADNESFHIGRLPVTAIPVPGHTPADMAFKVGDEVIFVGDTLFMPDVGTARCDFPGGDARQLYRSIHRLLSFAPDTQLYLCHDYPPANRAPQCRTTVAEQRQHNIHLRDEPDEQAFVAQRLARDATLPVPALLLPAMQVNLRAGRLPEPDSNGIRYLKIPLNQF